MFVVTVVFKVKKDVVEDFRKAVKQQAKNSLKKEKGCKRFDVCFDNDDPQRIFLYELYVDAAAFEQHTQTDHFKNIILGQAIPKLARRERSQFRFI